MPPPTGKLGIPIQTPPLAQMQAQGPKTTSAGVKVVGDPTGFLAQPVEDLTPRMDSDIPEHMLTPIIYRNRIQASPTGMANSTLHCQGFCSKYRCSDCKKAFNGNGSTTTLFVLKVVLHAVVVISEVLHLGTKSRCSHCCMAHPRSKGNLFGP